MSEIVDSYDIPPSVDEPWMAGLFDSSPETTGTVEREWSWDQNPDLAESLSLALGFDSPSSEDYAKHQGFESAPGGNAGLAGSNEPGLLDKVGDWVNKNQTATKLGALFVQGAISGDRQKDAAEALAASRLAELREQDRIKQEQNARFSQSVSGLRKPGLMSQPTLKRSDGSSVFGGKKLVGY